jgi:hypothetical protein
MLSSRSSLGSAWDKVSLKIRQKCSRRSCSSTHKSLPPAHRTPTFKCVAVGDTTDTDTLPENGQNATDTNADAIGEQPEQKRTLGQDQDWKGTTLQLPEMFSGVMAGEYARNPAYETVKPEADGWIKQ